MAQSSGYIKINDVRAKHAKVKGAVDWLGWIEFIRKEVHDDAVLNTARVIADVNADVLCLVEVEDRPSLLNFHENILYKKFLPPAGKTPYEHIILIDGNDDRGIDVALMSRHPITWLRSHVDDMGNCLETFLRSSLIRSESHFHSWPG